MIDLTAADTVRKKAPIASTATYLTGDSHGQSKEARCGAQEELETRQGKRQACAQEGKVQGPARGHEHDETRGQEKAAAEDSGKKCTKTSGGGAGRNHHHRRDRGAGPRCGCRY